MGFLRILKRLLGVFESLPGMFVSGLVIFLAVMHGGSAMRVRGEFVELCRTLMRVSWHGASHPSSYIVEVC